MKCISLVPSITETLFDFGLTENDVVGRTKFCIHPHDKVKNVVRIGGTKNLQINKIIEISPDLIIANKEENEKSQIDILSQHCNVWVTDIQNIDDNQFFLHSLGKLIGKEREAEKFITEINALFSLIKVEKPIKVAYLIWQDPYMTIGGDTFIHTILQKIGCENIFGQKLRYPIITEIELQPADIIMLSSEPYPFQQKHLDYFKVKFPNKKIVLVDGEAFSWYGTHLTKCGKYFEKLMKYIHL